MKSLRLVPAALLLCLALGASAAHSRPTLHPGVEAGFLSSTLLYSDPMDVWDTGWGNTFTGGATLDLAIARGFGIGAGVRYVCYSNHVTIDVASPFPYSGEFRIRANYVAVPLLATFAPRPHGGPRVGLGTEIAFLTSARSAIREDPLPGPFGDFFRYDDIRSTLQPVDLSLVGTLGWAVPLEHHAAIARVRFTRGVTNAARDEDWVTNWKTTGLDGTVGVTW